MSELSRKAAEMRNAIDHIEGALMGFGNLVDLPDIFDGSADNVRLAVKCNVGEMRRVCNPLAECTRIVNSEDYAPEKLR